MKLDPVLKKAWVANLRSNRFKQVIGNYITGTNGVCVLGCLTQTARDLGFLKKSAGAGAGYSLLDVKTANTLIAMNDSVRIDFPQLAAYIERNENI